MPNIAKSFFLRDDDEQILSVMLKGIVDHHRRKSKVKITNTEALRISIKNEYSRIKRTLRTA